eukprot:2699760-Pyramimonas_sp.AAC.2
MANTSWGSPKNVSGMPPVVLYGPRTWRGFREHSGNIQGTFREHSSRNNWYRSGNIQGTFKEQAGPRTSGTAWAGKDCKQLLARIMNES